MDRAQRIRRLSRYLRYGCVFGIIAAALLNAFYWAHDGFRVYYFEKTKWMVKFADTPFTSIDDLSQWQKIEGFLTDLIPYFFFLVILLIMMRLFKRFEKLDFFSQKTVRYIRQIGLVLLLSVIIHPFYVTLHSYIASPSNSNIQKAMIVAYGPDEVKMLFLALVAFLAAYIMEEGRRLYEENSSTI
jgi:hypothetical protein